MSDQPTAVPIPDDWDDLTDDEKDAVTAEMLKRVADETGVDRGSEAEPDEGESSGRPPRTFQKPADD